MTAILPWPAASASQGVAGRQVVDQRQGQPESRIAAEVEKVEL